MKTRSTATYFLGMLAQIVVRAPYERQRRQNHWFDALYNASAAGRYCGTQLLTERKASQPPLRYAAQFEESERPTFDYTGHTFTANINLRTEGD